MQPTRKPFLRHGVWWFIAASILLIGITTGFAFWGYRPQGGWSEIENRLMLVQTAMGLIALVAVIAAVFQLQDLLRKPRLILGWDGQPKVDAKRKITGRVILHNKGNMDCSWYRVRLRFPQETERVAHNPIYEPEWGKKDDWKSLGNSELVFDSHGGSMVARGEKVPFTKLEFSLPGIQASEIQIGYVIYAEKMKPLENGMLTIPVHNVSKSQSTVS